MDLAMTEKRAEEMELVRLLRADIINYGGMGAKKYYSPEEIHPLPIIDNEHIVVPIRTIDEALRLVKMFEAHPG